MGDVSKNDRRAAKNARRERKPDWAICAVHIGGQTWVKLVSDPAAFENRIGFMLRQGSVPVPAMAAAWKAAGSLRVEVLDRLDGDLIPLARNRIAEARLAHWATALDAARL